MPRTLPAGSTTRSGCPQFAARSASSAARARDARAGDLVRPDHHRHRRRARPARRNREGPAAPGPPPASRSAGTDTTRRGEPMNTRLDPPAVQLPPNVERRVRQRVLDHAVGRQQVRTRRWAPALAAAVGVVAVTATIVVADHSWNGSDAPVAAVPAPPNPIDAGAVTGTERDTAVNACRDATRTPDATVRYVRRVRDYSASPSTTSVAVVMRAKDGGSDLTCTRLRVGVGNDIGNGVRAEPAKTPPAPGSLIPIGSADSYYDPIPGIVGPNGQKGTTVAMPRFYQVHPSVARDRDQDRPGPCGRGLVHRRNGRRHRLHDAGGAVDRARYATEGRSPALRCQRQPDPVALTPARTRVDEAVPGRATDTEGTARQVVPRW